MRRQLRGRGRAGLCREWGWQNQQSFHRMDQRGFAVHLTNRMTAITGRDLDDHARVIGPNHYTRALVDVPERAQMLGQILSSRLPLRVGGNADGYIWRLAFLGSRGLSVGGARYCQGAA